MLFPPKLGVARETMRGLATHAGEAVSFPNLISHQLCSEL